VVDRGPVAGSETTGHSAFGPAGRFGTNRRPYEDQVNDYTIISGTPKTILPKIRHVLEYLRPGSVFFWDGDGAIAVGDPVAIEAAATIAH
jgi:hypothetical protein